MPEFICTTCGAQYPTSDAPPPGCTICEDERQYIGALGQGWSTLALMRRSHFCNFRQMESGLLGIGLVPQFAIGQRALLVRHEAGNVLWDCIPFIDDAAIEIVRALGGIRAIAISHPHYYTTMVEWARAFDAPILLHEADRRWVMRPAPSIRFWSGATHEIAPGLTLINCPGHFTGGTVLHWADGGHGQGAVLSGDILQVMPDKRLSFMRSYPNMIPLDASTIRRIAQTMQPWRFDTIYGAFHDRVIPTDAKAVLEYSVRRYLAAVTAPPTDP
jgi:glyoxylase-like metal-dependent hydrolase (beta-lactamase superfamily II)